MKKLLLVLQCCPLDQQQAMSLARLIADIEPRVSEYADIMLAHRFDSIPDKTSRDYVARKFSQVHTWVGTNKATGWPAGPNSLFLEAYGHYVTRHRQKKWGYAAMLAIEPDCCPLQANWLRLLWEDWHSSDQLVLGALCPLPREHLNGNMLISHEYLAQNKGFQSCPVEWGWDYYHRKSLMKHGRATNLIVSDYARKHITCDEVNSLRKSGACLLHGVKDDSAQICARKYFCT